MATRTHTTYFDPKIVDEVMGNAYKTLDSSFESRREFMSIKARRAIEARLATLRASWTLLLEEVPE